MGLHPQALAVVDLRLFRDRQGRLLAFLGHRWHHFRAAADGFHLFHTHPGLVHGSLIDGVDGEIVGGSRECGVGVAGAVEERGFGETREGPVGHEPFDLGDYIAVLDLAQAVGSISTRFPVSILTIRSLASPIFSMVPKSRRRTPSSLSAPAKRMRSPSANWPISGRWTVLVSRNP